MESANQGPGGDSTESFNLVHEPWILCRTPGGIQELSIEQVFDGSTKPIEVLGDLPTQDYAVLRVLLAIFWRAHHHEFIKNFPNPRERTVYDWEKWFLETREKLVSTGRDKVVLGYLEEIGNRFDLLSPTIPFMQVADLHTQSGTTHGVERIIPDAGERFFTMRSGTGCRSLSYAEGARWLIYIHAYDYSGIKSGAVGDPRVKGGRGYPIGTGWAGMTGGTVIQGKTLLETLLLNSTPECISGATENDKPVWERDQDTAAPRDLVATHPRGAADIATWQARRVRLFAEDGVITRVLVGNGDKIPDSGLNISPDPMTPYRWSKNKSKKGIPAYYPKPYEAGRTIWKGLDALVVTSSGDAGYTDTVLPPKRPRTLDNLARVLKGRETLDVRIVSMSYGTQDAVYKDMISSSIGLPLHMLQNDEWSRGVRNDVRDAAERTKQAATAVGVFAGQLMAASGSEYKFGTDDAERVYSVLEPKFQSWLKSLDTEQMEKELAQWQQDVRNAGMSIADHLLQGAGTRAVMGRLVSNGSREQVVSASTAYQILKSKLNRVLPLAASKKVYASKQEEGESKWASQH